MEIKSYLKFLEQYFSLFDAVIEEYSLTDNIIFGKIGWKGEPDKQDFKWKITITSVEALSLSEVCTVIKSNDYVEMDKFTVTEEYLLEQLSNSRWNIKEANTLINMLIEIEIKMIDDGEETDSFFLHF